jgi:hypothetical protein
MFVTLYRDDQAELRWLLRAIRRIGFPKSAPAALTEPVTIIGQPPNAVMSALGQKQTYALQQAMSALHPIATSIAYFYEGVPVAGRPVSAQASGTPLPF